MQIVGSILKRLAVGGVVAVTAVAAAGCGGGDDSASQPATSTTSAPAAPQATAPDELASDTKLARAGRSARNTARAYDRTATHYRRLRVSAASDAARLRLVNALRRASASYRVAAAAADVGDVKAYSSALVVAGESGQVAQDALSDFRARRSAVRGASRRPGKNQNERGKNDNEPGENENEAGENEPGENENEPGENENENESGENGPDAPDGPSQGGCSENPGECEPGS
jgi:hypothetical protein